MQSIPVQLSSASYEIRVGIGVFENIRKHLDDAGLRGPFLVVSQPRVIKAVGKIKFPTTLIPDGVGARHPAFDVTPAELITAIFTERGELRPGDIAGGGP